MISGERTQMSGSLDTVPCVTREGAVSSRGQGDPPLADFMMRMLKWEGWGLTLPQGEVWQSGGAQDTVRTGSLSHVQTAGWHAQRPSVAQTAQAGATGQKTRGSWQLGPSVCKKEAGWKVRTPRPAPDVLDLLWQIKVLHFFLGVPVSCPPKSLPGSQRDGRRRGRKGSQVSGRGQGASPRKSFQEGYTARACIFLPLSVAQWRQD